MMLLAGSSTPAHAHDIPNEIILHGFVKPEGTRLHMLVRVPLSMFVSVQLPKRGHGFLALDHIGPSLERATEITAREIALLEDGMPLSYDRAIAHIAPPSDRSFQHYETALASIDGPPLPDTEQIFWNQGYLDFHYEYPIRSEQSDFSLDFRVAPGLPGRLKMMVRYLPSNGSVRPYEIHGGFGRLALDPSWIHAAGTFIGMGFRHILDGTDHLLFLLCLVIPFGLDRIGRLIGVITAFTAAHSVTLAASAFGAVPQGRWFPPLVETMIAASILYVALENIVVTATEKETKATLRHRWWVTGAFGLVHGFGFSFALAQDLQFAGDHLVISLLFFNVGVEFGQLLVLLIIFPLSALLLHRPSIRRLGPIILSAFLAHTAWHWIVERSDALRFVDGSELVPPPPGDRTS